METVRRLHVSVSVDRHASNFTDRFHGFLLADADQGAVASFHSANEKSQIRMSNYSVIWKFILCTVVRPQCQTASRVSDGERTFPYLESRQNSAILVCHKVLKMESSLFLFIVVVPCLFRWCFALYLSRIPGSLGSRKPAEGRLTLDLGGFCKYKVLTLVNPNFECSLSLSRNSLYERSILGIWLKRVFIKEYFNRVFQWRPNRRLCKCPCP